ncbi:DMT family transporter (plasmid) [Roseomonas gilardii subsp. gilardii]|uniref:DMT family transporter n=1 Tax=Roseomonas gilardii TaxID=257708 RepID=UPI001FFA1960|nr:DMT family transporter [Roseomonas gilardii]UPG74617.1 DMT family transporter [Roseomonas gilardii subsp. gilardii]
MKASGTAGDVAPGSCGQGAIGTGVVPDPDQRNLRKAVLIMLLGIALFSVLNGVVKDQAARFPVNQIVFFRNAFALPPLILVLVMTGSLHRLRTRKMPRHLAHALTMTAMLMLSFTGFRLIPLAEATVISFVRPLVVILLAAPLLGEKVSLLSWLTVLAGFAGVLVVVQPGGGGLAQGGALFSLAAAFIGGINMLQLRALSMTDHTAGVAVWFLALSSLMLLPTLFFSWESPSDADLTGLIGMGLASGLCQYLIMRPLAYAGAAALAPVQYTGLLWSIAIGWLCFGDAPTADVLLGSAMVVGATMLVLRGGRPG